MNKKWKFTKKIEDMSSAELRKRIEEGYKAKMPGIKAVPYVGEKGETVTYDYGELTARCPMTGILDLYRVIIDFVPNKYIPELKSLKFYYLGYDQLPISHEHLCSKIYKDFKETIVPKKLLVRLLVNVRGGIYTTVSKGDKRIVTDLNMRRK